MVVISDFYSSILNIRNRSDKSVIEEVVRDVRDEIVDNGGDLVGFCKYAATNIMSILKEKGVFCYYIDLNMILGVDHVVLIAEYREDGIIKRLLIDPTFIQFCKDDERYLRSLDNWPSEKITDKKLVSELLIRGYSDIDDVSFNDYLNGFSSSNITLDIEDFLLNLRLNNLELDFSSIGRRKK